MPSSQSKVPRALWNRANKAAQRKWPGTDRPEEVFSFTASDMRLAFRLGVAFHHNAAQRDARGKKKKHHA